MNDLVSVIVPVYNMESSLEKSVCSIQMQDYENIEIILVDDGSKDDSLSVCRKLAISDNRIKYLHTENQGSGPARNTGIEHSKGRYLYFPDADDFLVPHAISTLVAAMEEGKYDLVVFGYKCISPDGRTISKKSYTDFHESGDIIRQNYQDYFGMSAQHSIQGAPWNKFFDGEIIRKSKVQFPALRRHQDECFISRYVSICKNVKFIPEVLYFYYPNTVTLEWKKYPVNYVDCVIGLNKIWKETICSWSENDIVTHDLVDSEILSKLIKVLELSFSPKMDMKFWSRMKWFSYICHETHLAEYKMQLAGSLYQRLMLASAKLKCYPVLYLGAYVGTIKNKARQGK